MSIVSHTKQPLCIILNKAHTKSTSPVMPQPWQTGRILVAAEVDVTDKMAKKKLFTSLVVLTAHLTVFNRFWMVIKIEILPELLRYASFCIYTSILGLKRLTSWIALRSITKLCPCHGRKARGTVHLISYKYCPMYRHAMWAAAKQNCLQWC